MASSVLRNFNGRDMGGLSFFVEADNLLLSLRLVKLQRQHRYRGCGRISDVDRAGLMAKVIHGIPLRHTSDPRALRPGVTVRMERAAFDFEGAATAAEFCRAVL